MTLLTVLLIALLLIIAYYDYKYLAIPLSLLVIVISVSIARLFFFHPVQPIIANSLINLSGLALLVLFSILILFLVRKKLFNPFNTLIGAGDLVFFPVICISLSPVNFLLFIIFSLGILLILKPLLFRLKPSVPLAGGMAFLLAVLALLDLTGSIDLMNDSLILNLLN